MALIPGGWCVRTTSLNIAMLPHAPWVFSGRKALHKERGPNALFVLSSPTTLFLFSVPFYTRRSPCSPHSDPWRLLRKASALSSPVLVTTTHHFFFATRGVPHHRSRRRPLDPTSQHRVLSLRAATQGKQKRYKRNSCPSLRATVCCQWARGTYQKWKGRQRHTHPHPFYPRFSMNPLEPR